MAFFRALERRSIEESHMEFMICSIFICCLWLVSRVHDSKVGIVRRWAVRAARCGGGTTMTTRWWWSWWSKWLKRVSFVEVYLSLKKNWRLEQHRLLCRFFFSVWRQRRLGARLWHIRALLSSLLFLAFIVSRWSFLCLLFSWGIPNLTKLSLHNITQHTAESGRQDENKRIQKTHIKRLNFDRFIKLYGR